MEFIYKNYTIESKKIINDQKIVTISDLHFNTNTTKTQIDELLLKINDLLPDFIIILGDLFTYDKLENYFFKKNILYFLKLLSSIGKSYLIFGNHDSVYIENKKKFFINIQYLLDFYQNTGIKVLNNNLIQENNINFIGFNKYPSNYLFEYKNIDLLKKDIDELYRKIKKQIDKNSFNILLTHSHLDLLKLQSELINICDLILAGHTHNGLVPNKIEIFFPQNTGIFTKGKLFQKNIRGGFSINEQTIIVNGGITKISDNKPKLIKKLTKSLYPAEIDLIKLNTQK